MRFIIFLFPLLIFGFNIKGYHENVKISKRYCYDDNYFNTYIILDNYKLDKSYVLKKLSKVKFIPHERVKVYYYDNDQNQIKKIFSFCVPGFTDDEKNYIQKNTSIFSRALKDVIGEAEDDRKNIFNNRLKFTIKSINISRDKKDFSSVLEDINFLKQSRIFIFSLSSKYDGNFNYSYLALYRKYVPPKYFKKRIKSCFMKNKGYLSGINYSNIEKINDNLNFKNIKINLLINNKEYKGHLLLITDKKGNLYNSWIEFYGILLAPIKGKAIFNGNKLVKLKAEVLDDYKYYNNLATKGDKIDISINKGKLTGKYYNYGYVLKNNPDRYFEYKIKE